MSLLSNSFDNRHYGLDVIRATSLLMILVVHSMIFVGSFYKLNDYLYFGVLAVELFFALSGFLIGTILLKVSLKGFSWPVLKTFWFKRWMRTLPAYFVVITVIMLADQQFYWSFVVFFQNYVPSQLKEFPVSWTITLEEWFYLTFPILLYVFYRLFFNKKWTVKTIFLTATLCYVLLPMILRSIAVLTEVEGLWDQVLRKNIFIRFDTIGYGLLIAWVHFYYPKLFFQPFIRHASWILALLLTGLSWWLFNQHVNLFNGGLNAVNSLIIFPMVNWVCILAIIFALKFESFKYKGLSRFMTTISITSYSLYLVHFQIFLLFLKPFQQESEAWMHMFAAIGTTFLAGFLLNITVEKYFLMKRNQWVK